MELPIEVWREILYFSDRSVLERFIFVSHFISKKIFYDEFFWRRVFYRDFHRIEFVDEKTGGEENRFKYYYEFFRTKIFEVEKRITKFGSGCFEKRSFLRDYAFVSLEERWMNVDNEIIWKKAYHNENGIIFNVCQLDTEGEEDSFRRYVDLDDFELWRKISLESRTVLTLYDYYFDDGILYCIMEFDDVISMDSIYDAECPKKDRVKKKNEETCFTEMDVRLVGRKLMSIFENMESFEGDQEEDKEKRRKSLFQIRMDDLLINQAGKIRISPLIGIKYNFRMFQSRRC